MDQVGEVGAALQGHAWSKVCLHTYEHTDVHQVLKSADRSVLRLLGLVYCSVIVCSSHTPPQKLTQATHFLAIYDHCNCEMLTDGHMQEQLGCYGYTCS